jgi:hypothetical protein
MLSCFTGGKARVRKPRNVSFQSLGPSLEVPAVVYVDRSFVAQDQGRENDKLMQVIVCHKQQKSKESPLRIRKIEKLHRGLPASIEASRPQSPPYASSAASPVRSGSATCTEGSSENQNSEGCSLASEIERAEALLAEAIAKRKICYAEIHLSALLMSECGQLRSSEDLVIAARLSLKSLKALEHKLQQTEKEKIEASFFSRASTSQSSVSRQEQADKWSSFARSHYPRSFDKAEVERRRLRHAAAIQADAEQCQQELLNKSRTRLSPTSATSRRIPSGFLSRSPIFAPLRKTFDGCMVSYAPESDLKGRRGIIAYSPFTLLKRNDSQANCLS